MFRLGIGWSGTLGAKSSFKYKGIFFVLTSPGIFGPGNGFFDDYIRPRIEDELFMADRSVVDSLVESGSDPNKEHSLEYVFMGEPGRLKHVMQTLLQRGYESVGQLDAASGQVVLAKRMALDLSSIVDESIANHQLAEDANIEFNGWGAEVIS